MGKLVGLLSALVCALALIVQTSPNSGSVKAEETQSEELPEFNESEDFDPVDDELESERQLKRMLMYVTPLMAILRSQPLSREARAARSDSLRPASYYSREPYSSYERNPINRNGYDRNTYDRNSYGGGGYSSYGYCCQSKDDILPLLALLGLAGLLLYLILIASTTTTAAGRKRRFADGGDENHVDLTDDDNIGKVHCYSTRGDLQKNLFPVADYLL